MDFKKAFNKMLEGVAMKRVPWGGYWVFDREKRTIIMHCKDGKVLDIRETDDVIYTVSNMLADDWEVADDGCYMDFGDAIKAAKEGKKISRRGWNGKRQYVVLGKDFIYRDPEGEKMCGVRHQDIGSRALVFVGTSGKQVGWLASQADMLAEDWYIADDWEKV